MLALLVPGVGMGGGPDGGAVATAADPMFGRRQRVWHSYLTALAVLLGAGLGR